MLPICPPQIVALSAQEGRTLLPLPEEGEPDPTASADDKGAPGMQLCSAPGLQPLHYQLELLLHRAGARQANPDWEDFKDSWYNTIFQRMEITRTVNVQV